MPPAGSQRGLLAGAFGAGLVHAAAFVPLGAWWLQLLALAAAIRLVCAAGTAWRGAAMGLAFGFGWFLGGVAWLFISMHRYGGMPAPMALAALALFAAYLAMFSAASLGLATPMLRRALAAGHDHAGTGQPSPQAQASAWAPVAGAALGFAGLWGAGELLRGGLFTGFPWLSSGYAHVDGPLAGLAPLVGVHGVGALAALAAAGLACLLPASGRSLAHAPSPRKRLAPALACLLLPLALGLAMLPVRWADETGDPIRVRLIQGNVPQQMKFDPAHSLRAMRAYAAAIAAEPADLIVLPETAWTLPWSYTPPEIAGAITAALGTHGIAAIGMPLPATLPDGRPGIANSVAAISGSGQLPWRYDKRHLVPFGEFVPFGFGWFVRMMNIPLGDFGRGAADQPALPVGGQQVAFNICYEDIFGNELAPQVRHGASILVNLSNIAWFGNSHALPQHLQIARMRAIELARPMLRATNTGITAVIDARGRVRDVLPAEVEGSLSVSLRGTAGLTPYARLGQAAPVLLVAVLALAGWLLAAARRPRGPAR